MKKEELEDREVSPGNYQRKSTPLWFVIGSILVAAFAAYYIIEYWGGLGPGVQK